MRLKSGSEPEMEVVTKLCVTRVMNIVLHKVFGIVPVLIKILNEILSIYERIKNNNK